MLFDTLYRDSLPLQTVLRGCLLGTVNREYIADQHRFLFACHAGIHAAMMRGVPANPHNPSEPEPVHFIAESKLPPTLLAQLVADGQLRKWRSDPHNGTWYEVNHIAEQTVCVPEGLQC